LLSWVLLVTGSVACLAANVAVAEPTVTGRVIAAWPSFALIGSYELLMRQVRRNAAGRGQPHEPKPVLQFPRQQAGRRGGAAPAHRSSGSDSGHGRSGQAVAGRDLQQQAWRWALAHVQVTARYPAGSRSPASMAGRSVGVVWSNARPAGEFASEPSLGLIDQRLSSALSK
jgi:hypothetical protein